MKLVEPTSGKIIFEDKDITDYSSSKMRAIRAQMQIIFQDPYSALNPRQTIGKIISAPFEIQGVTPQEGTKSAVQNLMAISTPTGNGSAGSVDCPVKSAAIRRHKNIWQR